MDAKHEKIMKSLQRVPENKLCFNCHSLGTQYVLPAFGTFVCTACSGRHMACGHRVKSISMGKFTPEEVAALEHGGNTVAASRYLSAWRPESDVRRPTDRGPLKVDAWIRAVFIDKRFQGSGPSPQASVAGVEHIPVRTAADVLGGSSTRLQVFQTPPATPASAPNAASTSSAASTGGHRSLPSAPQIIAPAPATQPAPAPIQQQQQQQPVAALQGPLFSISSQPPPQHIHDTQSPAAPQSHAQHGASEVFDPFGMPAARFPAQAQPPQSQQRPGDPWAPFDVAPQPVPHHRQQYSQQQQVHAPPQAFIAASPAAMVPQPVAYTTPAPTTAASNLTTSSAFAQMYMAAATAAAAPAAPFLPGPSAAPAPPPPVPAQPAPAPASAFATAFAPGPSTAAVPGVAPPPDAPASAAAAAAAASKAVSAFGAFGAMAVNGASQLSAASAFAHLGALAAELQAAVPDFAEQQQQHSSLTKEPTIQYQPTHVFNAFGSAVSTAGDAGHVVGAAAATAAAANAGPMAAAGATGTGTGFGFDDDAPWAACKDSSPASGPAAAAPSAAVPSSHGLAAPAAAAAVAYTAPGPNASAAAAVGQIQPQQHAQQWQQASPARASVVGHTAHGHRTEQGQGAASMAGRGELPLDLFTEPVSVYGGGALMRPPVYAGYAAPQQSMPGYGMQGGMQASGGTVQGSVPAHMPAPAAAGLQYGWGQQASQPAAPAAYAVQYQRSQHPQQQAMPGYAAQPYAHAPAAAAHAACGWPGHAAHGQMPGSYHPPGIAGSYGHQAHGQHGQHGQHGVVNQQQDNAPAGMYMQPPAMAAIMPAEPFSGLAGTLLPSLPATQPTKSGNPFA